MALLKNKWNFLDEQRSSWGTCHVLDSKEETVLLVDLPGAHHEDISLRYQNGHIEIQASQGTSWNRQEKRQAKRSVALPAINPKTITTRLESGILEIRARRAKISKEIAID